MRALTTLISLAATLALTTLAPHAEAAPRHNPMGHDPGFFMRLSGGFGFDSAAFDDGADTTLRGLGGQVSFAFGGTITRNLALHVDLFGMSVFEPSVEANGRDQGSAENTRVGMGAIGIGVTGYIMPLNLYLAGSIGAGVGTVRTRFDILDVSFEVEDETEPGLALNLMVGKEWYISRKWGIGLAAQVIIASLDVDSGNRTLSVLGFGLLFSATMN